MKKTKIIALLFTIAVCAVAAALLVGCSPEGVQYQYDYVVTFDYNVGNLGVATNCETQYLGIDHGNKLVEPGSHASFTSYSVNDYYNEGWYTAALDSKGNPTKDSKGNIILDKKWNFATDVVTQSMTLYANFCKNPTLTVVVDGGDNIVVSKAPGEVYNRPKSNSNKPQRTGYTFIDYYADKDFTTKFEFPYVFGNEDEECYALMKEGKWEVVTSASEFGSALSNKRNIFIDVPDGEIDCKGLLFERYSNGDYEGIIEGHGCVIKNITVTATSTNKMTSYSLFGNIGAKAQIMDLTFDNLTLSMEVNTIAKDDLKVALFATDIANGAQFNNVSFVNCKLNYSGTCKFTIETYGYYVTTAKDYDCFDLSQLTVTNDITVAIQ